MLRLTELEIGFTGETDGSDRMTWGQLAIWRPLQWFGEASAGFNIRRVLIVPGEGVAENVAIGALRHAIEGAQALRSRYLSGPDGPCQKVLRAGTYRIAVHDVDSADEVAGAATAQAELLAVTGFRLESEWPVRWCLIRSAGNVRAVVIVASHVAVDGWGMQRLLGLLQAMLAGSTGRICEDWQPLDQAAFERSARALRRNDRALAYWRTRLAELPDAPADRHGIARHAPARPRFQRWTLSSAVVAAGSLALAERTRTSSSAVLLTLAAIQLARLRGVPTVAMQLIAANRFTPRLQQLVAATAQDALLVFSLEDTTLREAVRMVYRKSTDAYFFAQYDPDSLAALKAEEASARGRPADLSGYFNDGRIGKDWDVTPVAGAAELRSLRPAGSPLLTAGFENHDMSYCVTLAQPGESCQVSLLADTCLIPPAGIRALLHELETTLCLSLDRDLMLAEILLPTGVSIAEPGPDTMTATE